MFGFEAHSAGKNSCLTLKIWPKAHAGEVMGSRGEATANILLDGHVDKLPVGS